MAYEIEAPLKGFESVQELAILIKNRIIIILVNREGEFKINQKNVKR